MNRISGIGRTDPNEGTDASARSFYDVRPPHPVYPVPPCEFSPRPLRLRGESRAFTLVELLVVLAVMGVLAGLLLPVLAGAREKGRQSACASNLRQLALADGLYAEDNDGYFAPAAQGFFTRDDRRWFGVRGADGRFEPHDGPLVPYLRDGGALRRCPSFRTAVGFDQGTGGYVYNYLAVGSRVWRLGYVAEAFDQSMSEAELARPAETAMFADGAIDIGTGLAEYGFMEPPPAVAARIPGASVLDPAIHFRHQERANVVFVDGHVRALPRALSAETSPGYPGAAPAAHGLGWFGPVVGKTLYEPE
jgi:prepilin-type processing-associated H-X9-DG protein/prepilin-type N-terminal cleavage/methylation domain-containing protein